MRTDSLVIVMVDRVPSDTAEGTLYVAAERGLAIHRCCCGCGFEVVTKLSPTAWHLEVDGDRPSLYPSIGNWGLPCQSHYIVHKGRVIWARSFSRREIATVRQAADNERAAFDRLRSQEERDAWQEHRRREAHEFWRQNSNSRRKRFSKD
jgi:hypothetical protein